MNEGAHRGWVRAFRGGCRQGGPARLSSAPHRRRGEERDALLIGHVQQGVAGLQLLSSHLSRFSWARPARAPSEFSTIT